MSMPSTLLTLPEDIRPFPKAGPRLENKRNLRKPKSTIYTDTPEKENLMQHKTKQQCNKTLTKKAKKPKLTEKKSKGTSKGKGKGKKTLRVANKKNSDEGENDENETFCIECTESSKSSISGEEWVQCTACKLWAHTKCVNINLLFYECKNCNSDLEY